MENSEKEYLVTLSVVCKNSYQVTKASEILARAGSGLALESLTINMNITEFESSGEEVGDQP